MRLILRLAAACALPVAAVTGCSPRPPLEVGAEARELKAAPSSASAAASAGEDGWSEVAPGVELKRFWWEDGGRRAPVAALRVAPSRLAVMVGEDGAALDAASWRARAGGPAAVNGGFFDAEGRSLGARLSRGRLVSKPHGTSWSVFRVKKIGSSGAEAGIVSAPEFADALRRGVRYECAVQCGPLLARGGRLGTFKDQWDRRTGLGIDARGRVVVAACDEALSLRGWANCFVRGLGCPDALNLDGGSSTQLSLRAGSAKLEWGGGRTVPDAVVIR